MTATTLNLQAVPHRHKLCGLFKPPLPFSRPSSMGQPRVTIGVRDPRHLTGHPIIHTLIANLDLCQVALPNHRGMRKLRRYLHNSASTQDSRTDSQRPRLNFVGVDVQAQEDAHLQIAQISPGIWGL
jgi:hypothetical protein